MITKMSLARYVQLMEHIETEGSDNSGKLTEEELQEGYHFCPDWDLLLVGPLEGCDEWGDNIHKCRCGYVNPHPENGWMQESY